MIVHLAAQCRCVPVNSDVRRHGRPHMKPVFVALGIGVVAFSAAMVGSSATWLFWDAWKASDLEAFRALVGGFSGGFFAYLFVRFGDALKKIYDRKELNYTSLIKLQHYFNDCLNTTSDNVFVVKSCLDVFTDARRASGELPVFMNTFHAYEINRDLVMKLTNVDYLNELFTLNANLTKMNDSLATVDRAYAQTRDALLSKNIDHDTYRENAWRYRDRCVEIVGFLHELKDELVRLLATARLLAKERPFMTTVQQYLVRTRYSKDFSTRVQSEVAFVEAEIEQNAEKSRQQIEKAQARRTRE